jgi:hypothetical protein
MSDRETVIASLNVEILTNCPNCDYLINLLDESDTNRRDHNEEGYLYSQAFPDGSWHEKHKEFEVIGVTCSQCKTKFDVKELEW